MLRVQEQWRFVNGLRGFACLIVVLLHGLTPIIPTVSSSIRGVPKTGVWLFFVLSAFLLTRKLISQESIPYKRKLASYIVSRFLRIYPIYCLTLLIYFALGSEVVNSWEVIVKSLLLQVGVLQFWTVAPEFKFYLLLPFILPILVWLNNKGKLWLILGSISTIVAHQLAFPYYETTYNSLSVLDYLPVFIFGVVIALLIENVELSKHRPLYDWLALVLACGFILAIPGVRHKLLDIPMTRDLLDKFMFYGLGWAIFIWLICKGATITRRLFEIAPLVVIGNASFPIYLCHWLIQRELGINFSNPLIQFIVTLVLTLLIGYLLHILIEKPIDAHRHKLERFLRGEKNVIKDNSV